MSGKSLPQGIANLTLERVIKCSADLPIFVGEAFKLWLSDPDDKPKYQWYKDNKKIEGETHSFFKKYHAKLQDVGEYSLGITSYGYTGVTPPFQLKVTHDASVVSSPEIKKDIDARKLWMGIAVQLNFNARQIRCLEYSEAGGGRQVTAFVKTLYNKRVQMLTLIKACRDAEMPEHNLKHLEEKHGGDIYWEVAYPERSVLDIFEEYSDGTSPIWVQVAHNL